MAAPVALDAQDVEARVAGLSGWELDDGRLYREVKLKDFVEAVAFMTQVAFAAEALDHHPDWSNSWNTVRIHLTTHSAGGLTELDFALAEKINTLIRD